MKHYSVLLQESINGLNIKEDGIYIDATLGYAGHSSEILKRVKKGFLFAFDQDINAIEYSDKVLSKIGQNYKLFHTNFSNMIEVLEENNINHVDGILFDLGLSSPQIDTSTRGFSFMHDAPLDMRMDQNSSFSALNVVNNYKENELSTIFFTYGEESLSKVIAKKIVLNRPINTTLELVNVISSAVGLKYFNLNHPERKIFQAIRIEVNKELNVLEYILPKCIDILNSQGRISIITFHSLEDRIVKNTFKTFSKVDQIVSGLPNIPEEYKPKIKLINKKPILPTDEELKINSRSKSAKLRIIERI